jgi:hypothetical protein
VQEQPQEFVDPMQKYYHNNSSMNKESHNVQIHTQGGSALLKKLADKENTDLNFCLKYPCVS